MNRTLVASIGIVKGKPFGEDRAALRTETLVGAGLLVSLPLGEYFEDRLTEVRS